MEYITIAGNLFAFIGSIMISSDLMLSKSHNDARSKTYLDANPFIIQSSKTNIAGFILIAAGFAVSLPVDIAKAFSLNEEETYSILFFCLAAILLIAYLLYRVNERRYKKIQARRKHSRLTHSIAETKE